MKIERQAGMVERENWYALLVVFSTSRPIRDLVGIKLPLQGSILLKYRTVAAPTCLHLHVIDILSFGGIATRIV